MLGLINLDSDKEFFFNDTHAEHLQAFADQAAIALVNARLYSEIENHAAELRKQVVRRTADLNRAKDRVEAILNSSTDSIILAHADGEIRQANSAFDRLFGYGVDEIFGLSLTALFDTTCRETVSLILQNVTTDGQIRRFETTACRKDGSAFDVEVGLSLVRMDNSQNKAVVCNVRDITERKRTEQVLRETLQKEQELSELKSRFISIASHEFRTPLAIILSAVESVKNYRHRMDDSQIEGRLDKVEYQVGHMTTLLDDVLTASQAQSRKVEFNPTYLDSDSICRSVIEDFQNATDVPHVLRFVSDGEIGAPLLADEKLLRRIITNLLSNAIKYSPLDSIVQVDLHRGPSVVILQVTDRGIGIPEEDQRHLFQPFHRATNVGTIPGTGLGLTIVKDAVALHGGTISVDSQVGAGSTFTISIPLSKNGD
jgi:PAS domain S-box-containing protein